VRDGGAFGYAVPSLGPTPTVIRARPYVCFFADNRKSLTYNHQTKLAEINTNITLG